MSGRGAIWVGSTTIGLIVGGFILHFPGSFGGLYGWDPTAVIFGGILGFITGVAVGLVQWAGLLLRRREGLRLLLWMGIGIGVTHALHDGAPNAVAVVGVASLSGLAMAAGYAWSFEERRPVPIVAIGLAWTVGLVAADRATTWMGLPWEETPVGWSTEHAIDGLIVGIIWGVTTALAGVPDRLRHPAEPASTTALDTA
jgi:hypothetical protein